METGLARIGQVKNDLTPLKRYTLATVYNAIKGWFWTTPTAENTVIKTARSTYIGSGSTEPSMFPFRQKYTVPRERVALIAQIRQSLRDNPRIFASWQKLTCISPDWYVKVHRTAKRGLMAQREGRAQRSIDRTIEHCDLQQKSVSWLKWGVAEGDLFIQLRAGYIRNKRALTGARKMPSASMERLSNDSDDFEDVHCAFQQKDLSLDKIIAKFPLWKIVHWRYDHEDGQPYGNSRLLPGREASERALAAALALSDRRANSQFMLVHSFEPINNMRWPEYLVEEYREDVGKQARIDRGEGLPKYPELFANGPKVTGISSDPNVGEIKDLEYMADTGACPLGVAAPLIGIGATTSPEITDDQRKEIYSEQRMMQDSFSKAVLRPIINFGLELDGINPRTIKYEIVFKQRYTETSTADRIDRALRSHKEGTLSVADVMRVQADYFDIENIDQALARLEEELNSGKNLGDIPNFWGKNQPGTTDPSKGQNLDPNAENDPNTPVDPSQPPGLETNGQNGQYDPNKRVGASQRKMPDPNVSNSSSKAPTLSGNGYPHKLPRGEDRYLSDAFISKVNKNGYEGVTDDF